MKTRPWSLLPCLILVLLTVAACSLTGEAPAATPAPSVTPAPRGAPTQPPAPSAPAAPISPTLTLTWWLPELLSPKAPGSGGAFLTSALTEYETRKAGKVQIAPVIKARYGKGGLLDLLRTAQPVAPGILPDIVMLDVTELEQAAGPKLLQPLDSLLPAETTEPLYPFARQAGRFGTQLLAVQFAADLEHTVYRSADLPAAPPLTWSGLTANRIRYIFPQVVAPASASGATADDLPHSFISQYLSAGGALDPQTRRLAVQEQPLLRVLTFYSDWRAAGLLAPPAPPVIGSDASWSAFTQGQGSLALVSARRYLAERAALKDVSFSAAPGWSAAAPPVAVGWALAITTPDPARQRAAADLIAWLLTPERAGGWLQAAGWLPTSSPALTTWGADPYYRFLDEQLAQAVGHPTGMEASPVTGRLTKAAAAVLSGASTPAEATQAALNPPK